MFGGNCLNSNIESIIMANDICNRYGLDTISAGSTIAFAIECFENGLIDHVDTNGLELRWGNHKAIINATEKLGKREGLGDILADGVKLAVEKIGKKSEQFAVHIQGQELPAHDPKCMMDLFTTYCLDATPGRHTQGSETRHAPGLIPPFDRKVFKDRAGIHKLGSNFNHIINCIGMCSFAYGTLPTVDAVSEFVSAITGWDVTLDELLKTGERIGTARHIFNLREGLNPLEFTIPDRVIGIPPHSNGPIKGVTIDRKSIINDYLTMMDWDPKTSLPSKKKLAELDIQDII
jgi:aldehyde:ferredoxin oxidoreductase